ncbi:exosortase A [Erythrobacter arachoides]|uniref:Exosortase A n=1 Tax=Aurantiacibacter arachoides TaxID=1850444 RepID=A0A845A0P0_9SPHN|nr:exosortase A [Aurantiacibacter arachoides]MXO93042.1 exosortase A [Aurantiacibacter arachoides]GGD52463.1 exosortase A [Aurantiacibacter arachoides]
MRLEALAPTRAPLVDLIAPAWRLPLLRLALAWAALLILFAPDWAAMASQWWDSSTYNHVLVVPAIIAWLVLQRADELAYLSPRAWWPGLVPMAGALFVWLLGDVSSLATASQLGAVAMLPAAVLTLLGPRVAWALAFPLAYSVFLVPVGEEIVPMLQTITAKITIALTEASGVPAHIEGVFIDTPAGLFEVAEACSGVKFLIAMIALGTLVAHVCFRSWTRRAAFMVLAVALPIFANGVRAWGTIYIAQSQGIAFAAGFDHVFYGWIFFALVMAMLMGIAWRFFDRSVEEPFIDGQAIARAPWLAPLERWSATGWTAFAALLALALAFHAWSARAHALEAAIPDEVALPDVPGWDRVATAPAYPWEPRAAGADRRVLASYRDGEGRVVDVLYALYAGQGQGREAGAYGEGALPSGTEWRWHSSTLAADGVAGERLQALGAHRRVAETWYRVGDWTGGSAIRLKLVTMRDNVLLTAEPTAMLILSAEERPGVDPVVAVADFRRATGGLGEWMDRAGSSR